MTDLQKKLNEKIKELDQEERIFNDHHRKAKRKKQNVIVPLQNEVRKLLIEVQGERTTNYKIQSA